MKTSQKKFQNILVFFLCLATGIAIGLSYCETGSNQQSYIPPGIRIINPEFLQHDWWISNAYHYHWAFFILVAFLTKINMLQWGVAVLNVLVVASSLYVCYLFFKFFLKDCALLAIGLFTSLFLFTDTFQSVAQTYLFSASLQASNISTFATIAALYYYLKSQYGRTGLLLGVSGIFHTNFLIMNLVVFGIIFLFECYNSVKNDEDFVKICFKKFTLLLGPIVIILAFTLPLILKIAYNSNVDDRTAEIAYFAFFKFAVPYHYYPRNFIMKFVGLLGWQCLGVSFLPFAILNKKQRSLMWNLQFSLIITIWSATALTTITFLESVSKLFLWRLAPFSLLISALVLITGTINILSDHHKLFSEHCIRRRLLFSISGVGFLLIARCLQYYHGIQRPFVLFQLLLVLILITCSVLSTRYPAMMKKVYSEVTKRSFMTISLFWLIGIFVIYNPYRYNLINDGDQETKNQLKLFEYVKNETPIDSQFLIPPDLVSFRLLAERAIVVDFKGFPFGKKNLVEWYNRLETISGIDHPSNFPTVKDGYNKMDSKRLDIIRNLYNVHYVVLRMVNDTSYKNWKEMFRNNDFRLLKYVKEENSTAHEL